MSGEVAGDAWRPYAEEMAVAEIAPGVRRRLTMNPPGLFPFEVARLLGHEVGQLTPRLRPIAPSHSLEPELFEARCSLVNTLVGAELAFGRSSNSFDPWKGSFAFPLLFTATRDHRTIRYLLRLRDVRGAVGIDIWRFQWDPVEESERQAYLQPVDGELSRAEMERLTRSLIELVATHGALMMRHTKPFFRTVGSELLVYGCSARGAFEQRFETADRYEERVQALFRELEESNREEDLASVRALLADVSQGRLRSP